MTYRQGASGLPRTTPPLAPSLHSRDWPSGERVEGPARSSRPESIVRVTMGEVVGLEGCCLAGFFPFPRQPSHVARRPNHSDSTAASQTHAIAAKIVNSFR